MVETLGGTIKDRAEWSREKTYSLLVEKGALSETSTIGLE